MTNLDTGFFGHPRGLMTLFFTEMWERFSYYGMRAILLLFMTAAITDGGLGWGADKAGGIYAIYTSAVYLASVPGGWLADNFLGQRKSVLYGGAIIMVGHILLALHGLMFFYGGLACVVIGTGFLKPNISVIVGQLYKSDDERRDAGFSIFYMGINIGAFTAPLVCGYLAQGESFKEFLDWVGLDPAGSWHWGFAAAAVGMFFGLLQYLMTSRNLGEAGLRPANQDPESRAKSKRTLVISTVVFAGLIGALAIADSTASFYSTIDYNSASGGLVLSGSNDGDDAEPYAFNEGNAVEAGDLEAYLGKDATTALQKRYLESTLKEGAASGELEDVYLRVPIDEVEWQGGVEPTEDERDGEFVRLGKVSYDVKDGKVALAGELILDKAKKAKLGSFSFDQLEEDEFKDNLGSLKEPLGAALLGDAVEAGTANDTLVDQSVKVGGVSTKDFKFYFTIFLLVLVVGFFLFLFLSGDWTASERARLVTILVLFLGAGIFWGLFEQAGSTLTLFADRSTSNSIFGLGFPSSFWQSLNALLIVALAPFFAWMWVRLGKRNPSYPFKFGIGLFFAGLGFVVLVGGATFADGGQLVSPMWLFMVYLFHTIGELCLSPVGLSSMTKLAPARVASLMMGVWFLAASVGNFMAGSVSQFYEDFELPTLFSVVGGTGIFMAMLMFALVVPMKKMMANARAEEAEGEEVGNEKPAS